MQDIGRGAGRFAATARVMARAYDDAPKLAKQFAGTDTSFISKAGDSELQFLETMAIFFEKRISRSALITFSNRVKVDAHDALSASRQPETYDKITGRLSRIFEFLEKTEVLPGRISGVHDGMRRV